MVMRPYCLAPLAFSVVFALFATASSQLWDPAYEQGWTHYSGHYYKLLEPKTPISIDDAQIVCRELAATLAIPFNSDEFSFLASLASHLRMNSWDECVVLGLRKSTTDSAFYNRHLPWCAGEPSTDSSCSILIQNFTSPYQQIDGPCLGNRNCHSKEQTSFICKSL